MTHRLSMYCFTHILPTSANIKEFLPTIKKDWQKMQLMISYRLLKAKERWKKSKNYIVIGNNEVTGLSIKVMFTEKNGAFYINIFKQKFAFEIQSLFKRYRRSLCPPQELNIVNALWTITWKKPKPVKRINFLHTSQH